MSKPTLRASYQGLRALYRGLRALYQGMALAVPQAQARHRALAPGLHPNPETIQ